MGRFGFVMHPFEVKDLARKFKIATKMPEPLLERLTKMLPAMKVSQITGIRSAFAQAEGWFVGCPLTARQMLNLPEKFVLKKIINACRLAEKLGAQIIGLGAFTSVVGDAGVTIARHVKVPVTTGNSYTIATAIQGTRKAAGIMGIDLNKAEVVILGATGSIGSVCARLLARDVRNLTVVARNVEKLEKLAARILYESGVAVRITPHLSKALKGADVVIAVSSAVDSIIDAQDLKSGVIVCDVARPRDVSRRVAEVRDDVFVFEGGIVEVPGDVNFNFDFGFPHRTAYACMAETMILALEKRFEPFTLGRELTIEQVDQISSLADKHGFRLAGFRSFEKGVTEEQISSIKVKIKREGNLNLGLISNKMENIATKATSTIS